MCIQKEGAVGKEGVGDEFHVCLVQHHNHVFGDVLQEIVHLRCLQNSAGGVVGIVYKEHLRPRSHRISDPFKIEAEVRERHGNHLAPGSLRDFFIDEKCGEGLDSLVSRFQKGADD